LTEVLFDLDLQLGQPGEVGGGKPALQFIGEPLRQQFSGGVFDGQQAAIFAGQNPAAVFESSLDLGWAGGDVDPRVPGWQQQ
jgi:hypothetical protein